MCGFGLAHPYADGLAWKSTNLDSIIAIYDNMYTGQCFPRIVLLKVSHASPHQIR